MEKLSQSSFLFPPSSLFLILLSATTMRASAGADADAAALKVSLISPGDFNLHLRRRRRRQRRLPAFGTLVEKKRKGEAPLTRAGVPKSVEGGGRFAKWSGGQRLKQTRSAAICRIPFRSIPQLLVCALPAATKGKRRKGRKVSHHFYSLLPLPS